MTRPNNEPALAMARRYPARFSELWNAVYAKKGMYVNGTKAYPGYQLAKHDRNDGSSEYCAGRAIPSATGRLGVNCWLTAASIGT